jgi:hypothetical protein
MAYCRMGDVEGGVVNGVSSPGLGLDLTQWMPWQPGPLTTTAQDFVTIGQDTPAMRARGGIPPLLARPPEAAPAPTPWLLLAGLGLVAYMVMR